MGIATSQAGQQVLHRVAENLYRAESTDIYYAILKVKGKQIKCRVVFKSAQLRFSKSALFRVRSADW